MGDTNIEWTDKTWNPVEGCTFAKGSEAAGCLNCYAARAALRRPESCLAIMRAAGPRWTGKVGLVESRLEHPLHWRKPQRIFVNSMSDLFHEKIPSVDIAKIFSVMANCRQHTFQILTKRDDRMIRLMPSIWSLFDAPLANVWLGVSVENRANLHRIATLRATPAAVRFLSLEPLLEDLGTLELSGIDQVIIGGESGPGARPCDINWIRNIIAQCRNAGVAVFVKQLGAKAYPGRLGTGRMPCLGLKDRKGGDMSEWPEDLRIREFPEGK